MIVRVSVFLLLVSLAGGVSAQQSSAAYRAWIGPDGQPLPFHSDAEVLDFLRNAEVISEKDLSVGVTVPKKVLLEKDGVRANAVFRHLDKEDAPGQDSLEVHFRDSYLFEAAAYELSVALGLNQVPPTVLRKLHGTSGSLQMWVEKSVSEDKRVKQQLVAPDAAAWSGQIHTLRVFDALIENMDRNQGNLLVTPDDWKLWFIDHTRAFRLHDGLTNADHLTRCDRALFRRLQELNEADLRARTRDMLRPAQVRALLKRRDRIVRHFQQLIATRGEEAVLFDSHASSGEAR